MVRIHHLESLPNAGGLHDKSSTVYRQVVEVLAKKNNGLSLKEIKETLKSGDSGQLSKVLENLCKCDFIRKYSAYGKKEQGVIYQLTDLYCLYFLKFIDCQSEFTLTKDYEKQLRERNDTFVHHTKTRDAIHTVLVTTYGLKENMYSGSIYATVTMDDLFK